MLLEEEKLDVNLAELIQGETPLFIVSKTGHINISCLLLSVPEIDVNKHTVQRKSPLIAASTGGHIEIARMLLAHPEIDANFLDYEGRNALLHAVINRSSDNELLNLLILCPSLDIYHRDENGNNVISYADEFQNTDIFIDPTYVFRKRKEGHTCCSHKVNNGLQVASEVGDIIMVKSFLVSEPDVKPIH